jgi:hypothetical protein
VVRKRKKTSKTNLAAISVNAKSNPVIHAGLLLYYVVSIQRYPVIMKKSKEKAP